MEILVQKWCLYIERGRRFHKYDEKYTKPNELWTSKFTTSHVSRNWLPYSKTGDNDQVSDTTILISHPPSLGPCALLSARLQTRPSPKYHRTHHLTRRPSFPPTSIDTVSILPWVRRSYRIFFPLQNTDCCSESCDSSREMESYYLILQSRGTIA